MTRYEKGFLTKCAAFGLTADQAIGLMKTARPTATGGWASKRPPIPTPKPTAVSPATARRPVAPRLAAAPGIRSGGPIPSSMI